MGNINVTEYRADMVFHAAFADWKKSCNVIEETRKQDGFESYQDYAEAISQFVESEVEPAPPSRTPQRVRSPLRSCWQQSSSTGRGRSCSASLARRRSWSWSMARVPPCSSRSRTQPALSKKPSRLRTAQAQAPERRWPMAANRKRRVPKTGPVWTVTALEATRLAKPRFNGFACGHGVHGDIKFNRAKTKQAWHREKDF